MKTSTFTNTLKPVTLALVIFMIGLLSAGRANASCTASFTDTVKGETVYFYSTSTAATKTPILNWNFGDKTTGSGARPTHTYSAYNTSYKVILTVYDSSNGCFAIDSVVVTTGKAPCSATAYFGETNGSGGSVSFTNYSTTTTGHFSSSWDFNDGKTGSNDKSPTHTYKANGVYHVCLYVVDSSNTSCNSNFCRYDTIKNACSANFVYALTTGLTVGFADSGSTALADKHGVTWNYGDNSTNGTGDYTYHTYSKSGTYQVCVEVYDSVTKCNSSYCTSIKVSNCTLASSFKYSQTADKFTFTSTSTSASKHSSFKWYFGDGGIDSTSGSAVSHTYTASAATEVVYLLIYDSATGCSAYSSQTITLCATKSDFTDKMSGFTVAFAADSTNKTTVFYSWNFGDKSNPGTGLKPSHTYSGNGTYNVCLTATDNATGCSSTTCNNVVVNTCTLTASYTDSISGRTVYFTGRTNLTSKHSSIKWYFSDGSPFDSTSGLITHHTFASSVSSVKVYLIVYDSTSKCQVYATEIITICNAKSDFTDKISGFAVAFAPDSTNNSTVRYSWNFGDKTAASNDKKPTHTYNGNGTYDVCLTAVDSATGCTTTTCANVVINNCTLTASFTDSVKGTTVKFYGKSNASSHVKITWTFGDNTSDSASNSYDVSHTYGSSISTSNVYMRVYDSVTKCLTYGTGQVIICDAQSNFTEKISGLSVTFAPNTSNNSRIKYSWNFGDKSDSRLLAPTHSYASYGTYQVCLTATDSVSGCSTQTCTDITLACSLNVSFTDSISGNTVKFYGTTGQISNHASIKWYFGDGDSSITGNLIVSHTYASGTGSANVYLRIYDSTTKCLAYGTGTITICDAKSDFSDKVSGLSVAFGANTTNSSKIKYSWNFGDKSDSRLAAPTHTYSTGGTYNVCLTATDSVTGCSTQTCTNVTVTGCNLSVKFTDSVSGHTVKFFATTNASSHSSIKWLFGDGDIDSTSGLKTTHTYGSTVTKETVYLRVYDSTTKCLAYYNVSISFCTALSDYTFSVNGLTVSFKADPNNNSLAKYQWDFNDKSNSGTTSDPTHTYTTGGTYNVCLTVTDTGCSSTTCHTVTVTGCNLTASFTDSVSGHTVTFFGKSNLTSKHSTIKWYFGDGSSDSTSGLKVTHTYGSTVTSANAYLRIYDSTTKCLVYYNVTITFCSASAAWTYASSSLTTKFLANGTNPSGTIYSWNFGDGSNNGTTKDPVHTYSKAGKYYVCLSVIDSPCYASICDSITVTAPTNTTYCISGTVMTSHVAAYPAKVFLIYYDSKDSTLDSMKTTQTNSKGQYEFCGLKNGSTYYTKAALDSDNSYFKYFIPTYHYDATKWTGANAIVINSANDTGENIIMKTGTNPGGAGFIGGKVSAGAGKTGDAEADILVVLYDSAGITPVAYTYTNSAGYYSFSGIAFGTYSVYGEIFGKVCYPAIVTITDTSSTDNSVDLQVRMTTITAAIKPAGTWTVEKADVYPNPVTNKLTLSMSLRNASPVTLKIYDITGKVVSELNTTLDGGAQKMEVDASSLPAGIYFLRMEMLKNNTLMEAQFVKVH